VICAAGMTISPLGRESKRQFAPERLSDNVLDLGALKHRTNSGDKMLGGTSTPVAEYDLEAESHEQPTPPWNPLLAQQLRAS
jgi:hypothetical protein